MSTIEEHKRRIKEHLDEINDAIDQGSEKKPITIGFHCSACSLELLELYLHKINKLPLNKILKHDWFKKPQEGQKQIPLIDRVMYLDFDRKKEIYDLIYKIEEERNSLLYGKSDLIQIKKVLESFFELKNIFKEIID